MRHLLISFLLLFMCQSVTALEVLIAHNVFYNVDATGKLSPNLELYWQINPRTVRYVTTPEKTLIAHVLVSITYSSDSGATVEDKYVIQSMPKTTLRELSENKIIDLHTRQIAYGMNHIKLVIKDIEDSANLFTANDSVSVSLPGDVPFFSGLQLLDTIITSSAATPFLKNGKEQVPTCTDFVGDAKPVLNYYAELYQTDKVPAYDYPLVENIFISKKTDNKASDFLRSDTISPQKVIKISGSIDIRSLASGNYYLRATLENRTHNIIASKSLFFQRMNTHPLVAMDSGKVKKQDPLSDTGMEHVNLVNLDKTFVAKYNLGEVREILRMMIPVSDDAGVVTINDFLKNPQELYMRYYIYNFFLNRDKDSPEHAWKEYANEVIEAKKKYSEHGTPGYATDRGAIFLRYGPPTDVITVENEQGALPYEIWQYNTLTQRNHRDIPNAIFLFYQGHGTFGYELLHSTVVGEKQNAGWRSYLYVNGSGGSNSNSRAEQYLGAQ